MPSRATTLFTSFLTPVGSPCTREQVPTPGLSELSYATVFVCSSTHSNGIIFLDLMLVESRHRPTMSGGAPLDLPRAPESRSPWSHDRASDPHRSPAHQRCSRRAKGRAPEVRPRQEPHPRQQSCGPGSHAGAGRAGSRAVLAVALGVALAPAVAPNLLTRVASVRLPGGQGTEVEAAGDATAPHEASWNFPLTKETNRSLFFCGPE